MKKQYYVLFSLLLLGSAAYSQALSKVEQKVIETRL